MLACQLPLDSHSAIQVQLVDDAASALAAPAVVGRGGDHHRNGYLCDLAAPQRVHGADAK